MDLKVSKRIRFSLTPVDKFGNTAVMDGAVRTSVSSEGIVSLLLNSDGLSGMISPQGPANVDVNVTFTGDALPGPAEKLFTANLALRILPGDAASFVVSVSDPENVPE